MKKLLTAISVAALIGAPAFAADMPVKAPPPPRAPVYSWTGFYVGGNFGIGFGRTRSVLEDDAPNLSRLTPAGVIGGGQAGYRFQYNWLVLGAEADIQWSGQNSTLCLGAPCDPPTAYNKLDWFGTVRGVLGIARDNWLWTVSGGYAYANVEEVAGFGFQLGNGVATFASDRATRSGWTIGTSVETRPWANNWSVKLEYLYLNLGSHTLQENCKTIDQVAVHEIICLSSDVPPGLPPTTSHFEDHVVRIGLNYNFGGPGPAPAPAPATLAAANWAGLYAGVNVGYGAAHDTMQVDEINPAGTVKSTRLFPQSPGGFLGGAQVGYRVQNGWFVTGVEADIQWGRRKDNSCTGPGCGVAVAFIYDDEQDWFGTVRGVAGVAERSSLWYLTGGLAYSRVAMDEARTIGGKNDGIVARVATNLIGWTAGAGVETKLGLSNWSAKLDYLYVDLGHVSFDGTCSAIASSVFGLHTGICETVDSSVTDHIVRVGLNYQFH
jgi:outer membrane immunogenic protein